MKLKKKELKKERKKSKPIGYYRRLNNEATLLLCWLDGRCIRIETRKEKTEGKNQVLMLQAFYEMYF